jgi:hypothetical protein
VTKKAKTTFFPKPLPRKTLAPERDLIRLPINITIRTSAASPALRFAKVAGRSMLQFPDGLERSSTESFRPEHHFIGMLGHFPAPLQKLPKLLGLDHD